MRKWWGGIFLFRTGTIAFTPGDRMLLRDFADQAAVAVRNARQVEQLRTEKARVEAIIENNPNGIMILDPQLRVEIVNRALSRLLGVAEQDVVGRHCAQALKLENRIGEHLCLSESTPPPPTRMLYGEGDIVRPGHKRATVGVSYSPLFGGDGRLVNIIRGGKKKLCLDVVDGFNIELERFKAGAPYLKSRMPSS